MRLLHSNLAPLAKICAKETGRYCMTGLNVKETEGGYRVEATDGRRLVIVEGDNVDAPEKYPSIPALDAAPNTATSALIPATEFVAAMKSVPKKPRLPICKSVAVVLGTECSTLATVGQDSDLVRQPRNVEGRFPDVQSVVPRGQPLASIRIDASNLADILKVAATFSPDGGSGVTLEFRGSHNPLMLTTSNESQRFTGVVMPLESIDAQDRTSRIVKLLEKIGYLVECPLDGTLSGEKAMLDKIRELMYPTERIFAEAACAIDGTPEAQKAALETIRQLAS